MSSVATLHEAFVHETQEKQEYTPFNNKINLKIHSLLPNNNYLKLC